MKLFLAILFSFAFHASAAVFSIAQFGDIHAPHSCTYSNLLNAQTFILSHTNDGTNNFVGVLSAGDLNEQDTNRWGIGLTTNNPTVAQFTNWWGGFTSNGLFSIMCPGNHDADAMGLPYPNGAWVCNSSNLLWNSLWPLSFFSSQPGYIGSRNANDSRNLIFSYTNGSEKFLFLTTRWASLTNTIDPFLCYTDQVAWVSNTAASYPNHNVIVLAHFFLNAYALPATNDLLDISGNYKSIGMGSIPFTNGWASVPNLMLCVSGHTQPLFSGHYTFYGTSGNLIDVSCFNMQDEPDSAAFFKVWTFDTVKRNVTANTYSLATSSYLTNYDAQLYRNNTLLAQANGLSQGFSYYLHNWTVPFAAPFRCTIYNFLKQ
jgi:hypothetical protein